MSMLSFISDVVDGKLEAVRFIDPITLVLHQPYDMSYMGEIVTATAHLQQCKSKWIGRWSVKFLI